MALNKCKAGLWIVSLVLVMVLAPGYCAGAAAPTSEAMVPLVPGAVPDHQAEAFWEEYTGPGGVYLFVDGYELPLVSEAHAFYSIGAPLEDVARYYVMELGAVEAYGMQADFQSLAEGETTPIYVEYAFYDWQFEDSYDYEGKLLRSGAMVRETLRANRLPHSSGGWLSTAVFSWYYRDWNGDILLLEVVCEDGSFDEHYAEFLGTKTVISVHRYTYMSEEAAWEMEDEAMDALIVDLAGEMALSPPTSESLGIPIYPGAQFQPRLSAGMSFGETSFYIFTAVETPAEVIKWYEKETGLKSESWDVDRYSIAISGYMPFPDKGLTVEPDMIFGQPWKTTITLIIAGGESDGWDD
jgi:hypothetical protein